jgi:hypothetical protein
MRYETDPEGELGENLVLVIPRPYGKPVSLNFSALTEQELQVTRQIFEKLFDMVEPIVKQRDMEAQRAFDNGDDSFTRIYRQVPQYIVREGAIAPYSESVFGGSKELPLGLGDELDPDGRVRADGDGVADEVPEGGGSEDDQPQAD